MQELKWGIFCGVQNYGACEPKIWVKEEISHEDGKVAVPRTCTNKGGLCTALTRLKDHLVSSSLGKGYCTPSPNTL